MKNMVTSIFWRDIISRSVGVLVKRKHPDFQSKFTIDVTVSHLIWNHIPEAEL